MTDKHLKREPHNIKGTKTAWWYEEEKGLLVVVERPGMAAEQVLIPWASLRGALQRKDRR